LLVNTETPKSLHRFAVNGLPLCDTAMSSNFATPPETKPLAIASAMDPAPTNPRVRRFAFSGASASSLEREAETNARLVVLLEQRRVAFADARAVTCATAWEQARIMPCVGRNGTVVAFVVI
jgi:hypothetical protein